MQDKNAKIRKIIQIVTITIAIVVTVLLCLYIVRLYDEENMHSFEELVNSFGVWGGVFMFLLQVEQVVLAVIPGEPIELILGALYGTLWGTLLCIAGIVCGTALIYILVQKLGKSFVEKIIDFPKKKQFQKLKFLHDPVKRDTFMFFLMFIPGTPKDLLTYLAPFTGISLLRILMITAVGRVPSIITSTYVGSKLCSGKPSAVYHHLCRCRNHRSLAGVYVISGVNTSCQRATPQKPMGKTRVAMASGNARGSASYVEEAVIQRQRGLCDTIEQKLFCRGFSEEQRPGYYIQTFGCQQNEADSERMAGLAWMMGYRPVSTPEKAELILVNTCAIREHAEKKALSIIGGYKHVKENNPDVIIGVGGCMVTQQHRADQLKKSYPYVDFVFDTGALHLLPELIYHAMTGGRRQFVLSDTYAVTEGLPIYREKPYKAWLSIMYGCNNFCSYCIVPYVRGRERSRRPEAILEEARQLIAEGAKDITLLGQNVNSYGKDIGSVDIASLMRQICALPGDFRLRFMTSHPKDASDALIAAMAEEGKIVPPFSFAGPIRIGCSAAPNEPEIYGWGVHAYY